MLNFIEDISAREKNKKNSCSDYEGQNENIQCRRGEQLSLIEEEGTVV